MQIQQNSTDNAAPASFGDAIAAALEQKKSVIAENATEKPVIQKEIDKPKLDEIDSETPKADDTDAAQEVEESADEQPTGDAVTTDAAQKSVDIPHFLSSQAKKKFAELPDDHKEWVASEIERISGNAEKKISQATAKAQKAGQILDIWADRKQELELAGYDEVRATRQLVALHDMFKKNPKGYLAMIANQLGAEVVYPDGEAIQNQQNDPNQSLLQELDKKLQPIQSWINQQSQTQYQQTWNQFTEKNPPAKHDEIKTMIGKLLQTGVAESLDDAYQMALSRYPHLAPKAAPVIKRTVASNPAEVKKAEIAGRRIKTSGPVEAAKELTFGEAIERKLKGVVS